MDVYNFTSSFTFMKRGLKTKNPANNLGLLMLTSKHVVLLLRRFHFICVSNTGYHTSCFIQVT